jgi:cyclopropane fatty-acyl-phospholipid synthase-like methyltransferase
MNQEHHIERIDFSQEEWEDIENQLERIGLSPKNLSGNVLDIGDGDGLMVRYLNNVNPGITCVGIDYDEKMESKDVCVANATQMPFDV